jgi:hypothetical protein
VGHLGMSSPCSVHMVKLSRFLCGRCLRYVPTPQHLRTLQDTAELWNTDQVQMEALFARLLKGSIGDDATDSGCVPGAALSAVACEAAVRLHMNSPNADRSPVSLVWLPG